MLEEAQRDQNAQARPELAEHVENMDEYDIVMKLPGDVEEWLRQNLIIE